MRFNNVTRFAAGYTVSTDKSGRESLIVVVKGTYNMPFGVGLAATLADEQVPLSMADEFAGKPGFSSVRLENDFAPRKLRCDVLLNGSCYAPGGKPARQVQVGLSIGEISKEFLVTGDRFWEIGTLFAAIPGRAESFVVMPLTYDCAYGGISRPAIDASTHVWYPSNPVGLGFAPGVSPKDLYLQRLPNTESMHDPVRRTNGEYEPMAFGPLGRSWKQRIRWAGTYDDEWRKSRYPFLPADFDERYFQAAPEDQQTAYLTGGESVTLLNLTPDGYTRFAVPRLSERLTVQYLSGEVRRVGGVVDTLLLEPDLKRFSLIQRTALPLRRNVHELSIVAVGQVLDQAVSTETGSDNPAAKPHYKSLSELARVRRAEPAMSRDSS